MHRASAPFGFGAALVIASCSFSDDKGLDVDAGATRTSQDDPPYRVRGVIPLDFDHGRPLLAHVMLGRFDDLWYTGEIAFATDDARSAAVYGIAASALPAEEAVRWEGAAPPFDSGWVLSLAPAYEADMGGWGHMTWTQLQMRVAATEDRTARAEEAFVETYAFIEGDDWVASGGIRDYVEALTDEEVAELAVMHSAPQFHEPLAPTDSLFLRVSHPVDSQDFVEQVRVVAGGEPVSGRYLLDLEGHAQDRRIKSNAVMGTRFRPNLLPPGAELAVETGELESGLGVRISAPERTYETIDAGDVGENLGFEDDLAGWGRFEDAAATGALAGVQPAEGDSQLAIDTWGYVAGYLDIPEDAVAIDMTVTVLGDRRARPRIHLATESGNVRQDVAVEELGALEPCDCAPYEGQLGPMRVTLDLERAGNERAGLKIGLNAEQSWTRPPLNGWYPPESLLVVDDITLR